MNIFLVKKAKNGDSESFVKLIMENKILLYKIARGYLQNDEDIADAIQDTILEVFQHLPDLREAKYFKTWMIRILINKCKDIQKLSRNHRSIEELNKADTGKEDTYSFEENERFEELLQCLDETERTIFILYYNKEFHIKEISEILHINENTVKSKLARGREKIKTMKKGEK